MDRIRRIERRALALIVVSGLAARLIWSDAAALGLALGGGLELLNLELTARLIEKILRGTSPQKMALIMAALMGKLAALALGLVAIINLTAADPVAVVVGVTLVVVAMVLEAAPPQRRR